MGFLIAMISGALMSVQGVWNTQVSKTTGLWVMSGFVQITAFAACIVAWLMVDRRPVAALFQVSPKYMLLGGIIGAFITYTVAKSMEQLGPAKAAMTIVVSQVIVAYLIELMGMFGVEKAEFDWKKLIGGLLAIAGLLLFQSAA